MFVALTALTLVFAGGLYLVGAKTPAAATLGFWAVIVVAISPRAGVVLSLATQTIDVVMNPEAGSGWQWASPTRILMVLTVLSYLARMVMGHRFTFQRTRGTILLFAAFACWSLGSIVWAQAYGVATIAATKIVIQVLLVVVAVDLLADAKAIRQAIVLLAIGCTAGGLVALVSGVAVRSAVDRRLALAGIGVNTFAMSVGFGVVATIALAIQRRTLRVILLATVTTIGMTLVTLRTGTRSVVIGVPLAVACGAVVGYGWRLHKVMLVGFVAALISGGSVFWAVQSGFITGDLRDRVLGTFAEETYVSNVRWELWSDALSISARYPMGVGAGNEPIAFSRHVTAQGALESHNTFLTALIEYNLVGLCIFVAALVCLMRATLRMRDRSVRTGATMLIAYTLFNAMKVSTLENRVFWQPLLLAMVMIESDFHVYRAAAAAAYRRRN